MIALDHHYIVAVRYHRTIPFCLNHDPVTLYLDRAGPTKFISAIPNISEASKGIRRSG
mgnify:CR=1 FL=1